MGEPSVAILLATCNGAKFVDEQLASIENQTVSRIDLHISDDASTDGTRERLEAWRARWRKGEVTLRGGPRRGFAENFRTLMREGISTDYVAFSDQDDVWDPDKLERAIGLLAAVPSDRPALYVSRTRLIDEAGRAMGKSPLFRGRPSFHNALVQSIGGGNTTVFNRAGSALVAESARRTSFVSHDWWCYLICSGAGGEVIYDRVPHISYRQHEGNLVGHNSGWTPRVKRVRQLFAGHFASWMEQNLRALELCRDLLTPEARAVMEEFGRVRHAHGLSAARLLQKSGLYRQTALGQLGLMIAAYAGML